MEREKKMGFAANAKRCNIFEKEDLLWYKEKGFNLVLVRVMAT